MDIFDLASAFLKGKHKTYSFTDISGIIKHPSLGVYTLTGKGTGSISINSTGDKTSHETAIDGSTFVLQSSNSNGTISISVQQTSDLHKWLLKWYNYLKLDSTERSEWARTSITIRSISDSMNYQAIGVSPQNLPTIDYQVQGQRLVWNLMCAEIKVILGGK